ncbi:MAG: DNA polymerase III subunit delta [Christensenellaceae bacterium]
MNANDAVKQLKTGKLSNFVIICGEDEYLKQYVYKLLLSTLAISMPELNLSVFEEKPDMAEVLRSIETLPFMDERRAVIIKSTEILSTAASAEQSKAYETANMPACNVFVIVEKGNVDKRKSFVKFVMKNGMYIECSTLGDNEIIDYIIHYAKNRNLSISKKNAVILSDIANADLNIVNTELQKLACVCRGDISEKEIEKYTVKSMLHNVYQIHDFMVKGQKQKAYVLIEKLLEEDNNPVGFITLLSNNFRQMMVARACRDARFSDQKTISHVMSATGVRDFVARKALENCKMFSAQRLRCAMKKLAQMDFDAKQGVIVLKTDLFALLVDIYIK